MLLRAQPYTCLGIECYEKVRRRCKRIYHASYNVARDKDITRAAARPCAATTPAAARARTHSCRTRRRPRRRRRRWRRHELLGEHARAQCRAARSPRRCGAPSRASIKSKNAAVLTESVGARASASRPPMSRGTACRSEHGRPPRAKWKMSSEPATTDDHSSMLNTRVGTSVLFSTRASDMASRSSATRPAWCRPSQ